MELPLAVERGANTGQSLQPYLHLALKSPQVFDQAGMLAGASGFVACGAAIAGSLWRARQSNNVTTYGSARWANTGEIKKAGLHGDKGVFLGAIGRSLSAP